MKLRVPLLVLFASLLAGGAVTSCATKPKVDWSSRIGRYTYDQAVVELGPPDRQARLSDGRSLAEWVVGHTGGSGVTFGIGSFSRHTGVGVSQTVGSGGRDKILRLTFDANNQLVEWSQN